MADTETLTQIHRSARDMYEAHGWSGCAGSSWENLPQGARDGWEYAARIEQARIVAPLDDSTRQALFERAWDRARAQGFTDDDGNRIGNMPGGHAAAAVSHTLAVVEEWLAETQPSATDPNVETITIRRPHVRFGPKGVPAGQSDARYLRDAAGNIEFSRCMGSNLTATVTRLLNDAADAVEVLP